MSPNRGESAWEPDGGEGEDIRACSAEERNALAHGVWGLDTFGAPCATIVLEQGLY